MREGFSNIVRKVLDPVMNEYGYISCDNSEEVWIYAKSEESAGKIQKVNIENFPDYWQSIRLVLGVVSSEYDVLDLSETTGNKDDIVISPKKGLLLDLSEMIDDREFQKNEIQGGEYETPEEAKEILKMIAQFMKEKGFAILDAAKLEWEYNLKYFPDGSWHTDITAGRYVELIIEGSNLSPDEDFLLLSKEIIKNIRKYEKSARNILKSWAKNPDDILHLSMIYCGKLYCGYGPAPIKNGFSLNYIGRDEHTVHTVIFSDGVPMGYQMWSNDEFIKKFSVF